MKERNESQAKSPSNERITQKSNMIQILDLETIKNLERIKELGNGASGTVYEVRKIEIVRQIYDFLRKSYNIFLRKN